MSVDYQLHPFCALFPEASKPEITAMAKSILRNGLRERIVRHLELILDGKNRLLACIVAGIEPTFVDYDGDTSDSGLLEFVLMKNADRRHMSLSQKALIAARMSTKTSGKNEKAQICALLTQVKAAKDMGVKRRMVQMAAKLLRVAPPELIEEVASGKKSLHKALKECRLPESEHPGNNDSSEDNVNVTEPTEPATDMPESSTLTVFSGDSTITSVSEQQNDNTLAVALERCMSSVDQDDDDEQQPPTPSQKCSEAVDGTVPQKSRQTVEDDDTEFDNEEMMCMPTPKGESNRKTSNSNVERIRAVLKANATIPRLLEEKYRRSKSKATRKELRKLAGLAVHHGETLAAFGFSLLRRIRQEPCLSTVEHSDISDELMNAIAGSANATDYSMDEFCSLYHESGDVEGFRTGRKAELREMLTALICRGSEFVDYCQKLLDELESPDSATKENETGGCQRNGGDQRNENSNEDVCVDPLQDFAGLAHTHSGKV